MVLVTNYKNTVLEKPNVIPVHWHCIVTGFSDEKSATPFITKGISSFKALLSQNCSDSCREPTHHHLTRSLRISHLHSELV